MVPRTARRRGEAHRCRLPPARPRQKRRCSISAGTPTGSARAIARTSPSLSPNSASRPASSAWSASTAASFGATTAGRRLSDDPVGLWQHVAARLPLGRSDAERQAGILWLIALAGGTAEADELVAEGLWVLGWADGRTGEPLGRHQAFSAFRDTWVVSRPARRSRQPGRNRDDADAVRRRPGARRAAAAEEPPAPADNAGRRPSSSTVSLRDVDPPAGGADSSSPSALSLRDLDGAAAGRHGLAGHAPVVVRARRPILRRRRGHGRAG